MKKLLLSLLLTLPAMVMAQSDKAAEAVASNPSAGLTAPGNVCPDFELKDYKGKVWHLGDFDGKVLVIDFWATWCGVCIANLPAYAELAAQYEGNDKIQFITISIDTKEAEKRWMYSLPRYKLMKLVNLICPKKESPFAEAFGVNGVPRYVIIGPDRKIIENYAKSPHDGLEEQIKSILQNL